MESYEELLNKAYESIKVVESNGERFEIPKIEGRFEGKKTILTNFLAISSHLRRPPEHIIKFLTKELATKASIVGERLILNMKIPSKKMNPKIEQYVNEFVICQECKKPDTKILKEGKQSALHCLACGAKHVIRTKI